MRPTTRPVIVKLLSLRGSQRAYEAIQVFLCDEFYLVSADLAKTAIIRLPHSCSPGGLNPFAMTEARLPKT